jgi:hypothetical protein
MENVPIKRISIDGGGRNFPIVPHLPLLSSASHEWDGFLLERHLSDGFDVPKHSHSSILLSMQLNASLRLGWKSEQGRAECRCGGREPDTARRRRLQRLDMGGSLQPCSL